MIERCPCCNARLKQALCCPRCKADLSNIVSSEQSAQYYLSAAIQAMLNNNIEKSSMAISQSLHLKITRTALFFRDFLIQQQTKEILDLLAQTQLISAKNKLYTLRQLIPYSKKLQQLDQFASYLLFNH